MFGNSRRVEQLEKEVQELRNYIIKFTNDVNDFSGSTAKRLAAIVERINILEEK